MATSAAKWREEQILVVCPGSRTTMAQLGCSELTPPTHRFPTRMFPDGDEWRPYHTYKRTRVTGGVETEDWVEDVDSDEGAVFPIEGGRIVNMDAFLAFLDHVHGMLTTTYHNTPIMLMASPQWTRPDCEAIAQYIFEKTRTPALCMIHSGLATQYGLKWPNMTVIDIGYEKVDVTAIHDGRVVNHMDLGSPNGDRLISGGEVFTQRLLKMLQGKGFSRDMAEQLKKSTICEVLPYAPGEDALVELPREVTAGAPPSSSAPAAAAAAAAAAISSTAPAAAPSEAPKPAADYGGDEDEGTDKNGDEDGVLDVAAIVTSGQTKEFLAKKEKEKGKPGRKPKGAEGDAAPAKPTRLPNAKRTHNTFFYEEVVQEEIPKEQPKPAAPQETNGNGATTAAAAAAAAEVPPTAEAPAEGSAEKPAGEQQATASAPTTTAPDGSGAVAAPQTEDTTMANGDDSAVPKPEGQEDKPAETNGASATAVPPSEPQQQEGQPKPEPTEPEPAAVAAPAPDTSKDTPEFRPKRIRRDVEIGLERFTFAERAEIDRIVSTIYRTIQGIDDMYMRPACWDNLVFVGNGARLRGLRDNILQTLTARHLVSPSTATMFTSELPSNVATPTGTGSQTPTGSFTGVPHQLPSSGVNPLLQAATTASSLGAAAAAAAANNNNTSAAGGAAAATGGGTSAATPAAGSDAAGPSAAAGGGTHYHFHSQTPTSIKTAALPTYLSEWTKNGFEEAMFLGAQVAARIAFCLHSNMDAQSIEAQRLMSLSRVDYNELGPKAIRTHSMLS
ncbi:Feruloyl esterase [Purpureocillium takamizusanense]|uniref:Feruloyl esterase n=1 Tax=Purpureocillium takamizusanense TaxID=2060973 RepID=A0A9Q8VEC8_9HYPO|nr:Feruloyl esterase [Purpureocillium takamizusanense]UNI21769.1 Feruloyl esterase [Purpureocillium takamizusanense]